MNFRPFLASLFSQDSRRPLRRKQAKQAPNLESLEVRLNPADLFYPDITPSIGGNPSQWLSAELNGDGNLDLAAVTGQAVTVALGDGKGQFLQPRSIDLGSPIYSLAAKDLDGDGRADLAAISWQTNAVSILMNHGDGTFEAPRSLPVGGEPTTIALDDFDADGKIDLVVSNYGDDTLTYFVGSGGGAFGSPMVMPVGDTPIKLTSGDFNGDGKADLACILYTPGSLSILLGNGNGTFQSAHETNIGARPLGLVAGDLNADKKSDIVCVFEQNSVGSVFLFQSDGTFTTSAFNVDPNSFEVQLTDLNGDGKLDATISSSTSGGISIAMNDGIGGLVGDESLVPPGFDYCLTPGDFNNDSKVDLVASQLASGSRLFLGNGNGTFSEGVHFGTGSLAYTVFAGDFTNDGTIDLITANILSATLTFLAANADLTFQSARIIDLGDQPIGVFGKDLNSDGKLDLLVPLKTSGQTALLFGNGNGTFQSPQIIGGAEADSKAAKMGDMNGDSIQDLVVSRENNTLSIYYGRLDGMFSAPDILPTLDTPVDFELADINGDGQTDIAVTFVYANNIEMIFGKREGTSWLVDQRLTIPTTSYHNTIQVADFNGDGRADIAVDSAEEDAIEVFLQSAERTFGGPVAFPSGNSPIFVDAVDLNRDGAPDLAVAKGTAISVLINDRKGGFFPAVQYASGAGTRFVGATDVNQDGIVDLISAGSEPHVQVYLGIGDGTFCASQLTKVGAKPQAIVTGDFNRDGKLDWVTLNSTDNTISIALGQGNGSFGTATVKATGANPVSLIVADFNRDGNLDLAVANQNDLSLSIYMGNGDGKFQSVSTVGLNNAPNKLAFDDFNHDGKIDIAITSYQSKRIEILLGKGDGTFQGQKSIAVEGGPFGLTVGDFNQDGQPDLATILYDANQLALLLGNGDGSFQPASLVSVAEYSRSITCGDFNGDGKLDLAISHSAAGSASIHLASGGGGFEPAFLVYLGPDPYRVIAADVNRDGKADLIAVNNWGGSVSVLISKGPLGFEEAKQYATGGSPAELAVGDFNGDQRPDIVTADSATSTVSYLANSSANVTLAAIGPLVYGSSVILSAKVVLDDSASIPTGQITFKKGSTILGKATLALKNGEWIATLTLPMGWNAGTQADIWAQYSGDKNNEAFASAHMNFEVAPKLLTVVATPMNKIYDGMIETTAALTVKGLIGTDKVAAAYTSANFADPNAGAGKTVVVNGIRLTGASAANYRVHSDVSSKAIIIPKALTVTANNKVKVYGQALPELTATFTGLIAGDTASEISGLKLATAALASSKVGAYAITASGATSANYKIAFVSGTLNVSKATLTVLPADQSKVYGAAMPIFTSTIIGLVNGDPVSVVTGLKLVSTATAKSSVGRYAIVGSGAISANYVITFQVGVLQVTKAALTVAPENKVKVYGAALPALTAKFTGLVNGDKGNTIPGINLATSALPTSNVGEYPITIVTGASSNYEVTLIPGTLTVLQAKLVIAAEKTTRIYGDALPAFTAKFTGLVNGDKASAITGLTYDTLATPLSHVGTYSITPMGAVAPNYTITYRPSILTIAKKPITAYLGFLYRTYGTPLDLNPVVPNPYYQNSSLFTQNSFDISAFKTRFTFLVENSGITEELADGFTFTIQGNGANAMGSSGSGLGYQGIDKSVAIKFDLFDNDGEGNNSTGLYLNGANPSTLVSSINLNGTGIDLRASRKLVADLSYANKKLAVTLTDPATKKTATQTYSVDIASHVGSSKAYFGFTASTGGSAARQTILDWSAQDAKGAALLNYKNFTGANGLVANGNAVFRGPDLVLTGVNKESETPTSVNGETLSYALQSTGNLAASPVGIYALKMFAFDGTGRLSDYEVNVIDGRLIVKKAPLTITADNKTKVYGQAMPPLTATFTGLMNHETSKVVTGLKIASTATAASKVGTYTITPSAGVAANYAIKYETGSLNVTKAALTIAAENKTKLAGAANPVFTAKYTGLVNGDKATAISGLVLSTEATQASGPGLQTIVASGASSNNYEIQFVSGTLAINQAPAITSANSTTFTRGQQNTFTIQASGFPVASFALSKGVLPAGVILNKTTGVLSGTPTAVAGTYTFIISATNGIGAVATQIFNLIIS